MTATFKYDSERMRALTTYLSRFTATTVSPCTFKGHDYVRTITSAQMDEVDPANFELRFRIKKQEYRCSRCPSVLTPMQHAKYQIEDRHEQALYFVHATRYAIAQALHTVAVKCGADCYGKH